MSNFNLLPKLKEPVRLRAKSLADGSLSLYLDTYYKGKRVYEFLRLYLIPERSAADRKRNAAILHAANAIKASRTLDFVNGRAEIRSPELKLSIKDWISHLINMKAEHTSKSGHSLLVRLQRHLANYSPHTILAEADREYCLGFARYLRSARALNSKKTLKPATQFELLNALSIILNEAVRAGKIPANPMRLLNAAERIRKPVSERAYLTPEEVKAMAAVAEENIAAADDVAAFLFCCFCGLRYSDVSALTWRNIVETDSGLIIKTTMKKTRRPVEIPLSKHAVAFLPEITASDEKIFSFPQYAVTAKKLRIIAKRAGIRKKVTFHVSRHTFATMMLTAGADLYTISKLIGHTDVRTTQIYSKVVDKKKYGAISLLDNLF